MNSNTLLEKLDKILSPIGVKVGNQRHLKAISSGMMMTLPLIVVGSLFLIVANPPGSFFFFLLQILEIHLIF